jgi:hypothetical protein
LEKEGGSDALKLFTRSEVESGELVEGAIIFLSFFTSSPTISGLQFARITRDIIPSSAVIHTLMFSWRKYLNGSVS